MAPQQFIEIGILKLTFFPYEHPLHPRMYMKRREIPPTCTSIILREWISRVLSHENSKVPPNVPVTYCEWNIISYDSTLFTVGGFLFDNVILIMGEEVVHWMFSQNMGLHKPIEGSGTLTVKHCACCLGSQHLNIMATVLEYVHKKRGT